MEVETERTQSTQSVRSQATISVISQSSYNLIPEKHELCLSSSTSSVTDVCFGVQSNSEALLGVIALEFIHYLLCLYDSFMYNYVGASTDYSSASKRKFHKTFKRQVYRTPIRVEPKQEKEDEVAVEAALFNPLRAVESGLLTNSLRTIKSGEESETIVSPQLSESRETQLAQ